MARKGGGSAGLLAVERVRAYDLFKHPGVARVYEIRAEASFSAAHRLRGYEGECEHLHGHNYRVRIALRCKELNPLGMAMDFKEVKGIAESVVSGLDHRYLNEVAPFDSVNPTAEQIAEHIAGALGDKLPDGVWVHEVTCWESDRCSAAYLPDSP